MIHENDLKIPSKIAQDQREKKNEARKEVLRTNWWNNCENENSSGSEKCLEEIIN